MKKTTRNDNSIPVTAVSGTTPIVEVNPIMALQYDAISYQLITTGSAEGAWTFAASNNYNPVGGTLMSTSLAPSAGTWDDITSAFSPAAVTTASDQLVSAEGKNIAYAWIKATFTPSSGTGNVSAFRAAKGNE